MPDLTFGVEIECFLPKNKTRQALADHLTAAGTATATQFYGHHRCESWKIVTDGSLGDYDRGCELVSPVLSGVEGFAAVRVACDALVSFGCTVKRTCGLHVHVGVPTTEVGFFKKLIGLYAQYEPVIDTLVSPSRRDNSYCRSVGSNPRVNGARTLETLRAAYGHNRYRKLNLEAYWRHGTVEFRQHQGTVEGEKVVYWASFCIKMVAAACGGGDSTKLNKDAIISYVAPNPKKYGSKTWEQYNLYRTGMTVGEALHAGFHQQNIRWDLDHGFLRLGEGENLTGLMNAVAADEAEREYFVRRQQALNPVTQ